MSYTSGSAAFHIDKCDWCLFFQGAHSDKLFCRIVSAAVGSVIRHSMDSSVGFRQQCYELLQVCQTWHYHDLIMKIEFWDVTPYSLL